MDVKSIIKEKGFTIEQVAKEMGISRVTFTQNLSRNPTMRTLQRIADVLGCKVGDFFKDEIVPSVPQSPAIICPHCGKPIELEIKEKERK